MRLRLLCIAVGIMNALVCVFGSQFTREIWIAGFVILCHMLYGLVQNYEREQGENVGYVQGANDTVEHIRAKRGL
jgi:hypothetical protein